jgi:hypothetical protein
MTSGPHGHPLISPAARPREMFVEPSEMDNEHAVPPATTRPRLRLVRDDDGPGTTEDGSHTS